MICNITIIFTLRITYIFIFIFSFTNITDFAFWYEFLALLFITSFFKIISIVCYPKDSQRFFMQSLPLYTSYLFSMILIDDILDIEKTDGTCLPTFVVDEFSGYFIHQSFLLTFKIYINNKWWFIRFLILIKFLCFSVFRGRYNVTKLLLLLLVTFPQLFWWKICFFPVMSIYKRVNVLLLIQNVFVFRYNLIQLLQCIKSIYYYFLINTVYCCFFYQSGDSKHDPPQPKYILWHL